MRLRDLHRFDDAASRIHFTRRYSSNSGNVCGIAETKTTISFNVTILDKEFINLHRIYIFLVYMWLVNVRRVFLKWIK